MVCEICGKSILENKKLCLECFIRSGLPNIDPRKTHWSGDTQVFVLPSHVSRPDDRFYDYYESQNNKLSWVRKFTIESQKYKVFDLELDRYENDALDLLDLESSDNSFFSDLWMPMIVTLLIFVLTFIGPYVGVKMFLGGDQSFANLVDDIIFKTTTQFGFTLAVGLYFLPTIIAYLRGKLVLGLVNAMMGITVIGWIVMLVFACKGENKRKG